MTIRILRSSVRRLSLARVMSGSGNRLTRLLALPVAVILGIALLAVVVPAAHSKAASCANPVACENQLPGTPQSVWDSGTTNDTYIQGFADPFSVNVGGSINFKI